MKNKKQKQAPFNTNSEYNLLKQFRGFKLNVVGAIAHALSIASQNGLFIIWTNIGWKVHYQSGKKVECQIPNFMNGPEHGSLLLLLLLGPLEPLLLIFEQFLNL